MPNNEKQQIASKILSRLDAIASMVGRLRDEKKISPRVAAEVIHHVDAFADKTQIDAYGPDSFKAYQQKVAKVIQKDSDEKFMDTFDNTVAPLQTDADETFMHKTGPSFNSKGQDTFDADRSSTVSERDEYAVRELNEHAGGTKKQPTWTKGPAGKSTKQGSAKVAPAKSPAKTWAD